MDRQEPGCKTWDVESVALVQSALQIQKLIDQMPGGFFIYRAEDEEELLYANQAVARLFGCDTVEELRRFTGNTFRGIVHPEDLESVEASIQEQIESSQYDLDYVEYRIVQKDGSVRWVEDYGHFVRDEAGRGLFYVFVADATEKRQKQVEERAAALETVNRELRRRLNIIEGFRSEYESIFYVDLDEGLAVPYQASGRVQAIIPAGEGCLYGELIHDYVERCVHPEDRELLLQATEPENLRRRLAEAKASHVNYRVVDGQGKTAYLQLRMAAVGESGGAQSVWGCRSMDEEIAYETERRELLEQALRRASAAVEAKNAFLSNISHDTLTPMNTIMACAALARKDKGKLNECLDQIETAGQQMLRLMGNVLELSRLEGGQVQVIMVPCDLGELLETVKGQVTPLTEDGKVRVEVDLSGVRHPVVYADREKLERTLFHLASNAVKYTRNGGRVRLSVVEEGVSTRDYAVYRFKVEDDGIGIPAESMSRLFEPFERQLNSTLSGVAGAGLGLTIVKSTVELLGGSLTADSRVNKGSCFTVTLTLKIHGEGGAQEASARQAAGSPWRILLAEDNEINRELYAELLEGTGCTVETVENGQEAVERIRASRPGDFDLVLMDIQMPVMDGNTAARMIRALPDPVLASIPIVALSANALEEDRKRSMESGMNAHLAKPIQMEQLMEVMEQFVDRDR